MSNYKLDVKLHFRAYTFRSIFGLEQASLGFFLSFKGGTSDLTDHRSSSLVDILSQLEKYIEKSGSK